MAGANRPVSKLFSDLSANQGTKPDKRITCLFPRSYYYIINLIHLPRAQCIDVRVTQDWDAGDYPPEDGIYLWGPEMPSDFVHNYEAADADAVTPGAAAGAV